MFQCKMVIQWNPSCGATPFASEKWPFKRGGLSSVVKINTFMSILTLSSGLSRGGGLSSGWPLKRGSTVLTRTRGQPLWKGHTTIKIYHPNLVIMPVRNNEHQRIDVSTDLISYGIHSLETIGFVFWHMNCLIVLCKHHNDL